MKFKTIDLTTMNKETVPIVRPDCELMFTLKPVQNLEHYRGLEEKAKAANPPDPKIRAFIPGQGEVPIQQPRNEATFFDYIVVSSMTGYAVTKEVKVTRDVKKKNDEGVETDEIEKKEFYEKQIVERGPVTWELVDVEDLNTYPKWREELSGNTGLTEMECNRLQMVAFELNNMSQATLQRAREDFLRLEAETEAAAPKA